MEEFKKTNLDLATEGNAGAGEMPQDMGKLYEESLRDIAEGEVVKGKVVEIIGGDVFVDIGSGLGFVVFLVNLLTGVHSVGIEYDPAYCQHAQEQANDMRLENVTFINTDARDADLNVGTVFYLFTPFVNEIFNSVMERLRYTAMRKPIYICSYGTITFDLVKLPWLKLVDPAMEHDFKLAVFTS